MTLYWSAIHAILNEVAPGHRSASLENSILGLGLKAKSGNPTNRFVNLGLILAKHTIIKHWKAKAPPMVVEWHAEVLRWGRGECAELQREERRGLRKKPISLQWNMMLEEFIANDI